MDSQCSIILKHLETYTHWISSMEAFEKYGITRLSGRIFDLRNKGYDIESYFVDGVNRYGEPTRYSRYILR